MPQDDALVIPIPNGGASEAPKEKKAMDPIMQKALEGVILSQAQGHAFCMEQGRLGHLDGKVGFREGLTHRIIGEAGGGQARAFLPAGMGGVPTTGTVKP